MSAAIAENDQAIPFRVSHAEAIVETRAKVDLLTKIGIAVGGATSAFLAAILTVLIMR